MRTIVWRSIFGLSLLLCLTGLLVADGAVRNVDLRVVQGTPREKDLRDMMLAFLLRQADQATAERLARLEAIKSDADIRTWQEANRAKFLELIGGLPDEHTPLNARLTGEVAREGYVVRKVIFESLPEFYVTANLYVPTVGKPPYPGVLAPVGHAPNGKAYTVYQHLFIGLAKRGYVVLTYDPQGQGERLQYWDLINSRRSFEFNQHAMAGLQLYLLGQNLARYFIWDGIRALDYLASLPEVDSSRIGCTGSSGGGTLTTYISMLDPRIKVASIVTFISSIPKKIEARSLDSESDPEQDIPGLLAAGIDHTEFVGMIAPRPVLIGAATRDFFPIEGTRKTFAELQDLYSKLGVPDHIKMVEFDHRHMYSQPLREATTAWFDRWLKRVEGEVQEPPLVTESDRTLECTPTGQVMTSLGGKSMHDFNRAEAEQVIKGLAARRREGTFWKELLTRVRERLVLPSTPIAPQPQRAGQSELNGLTVEKLLLETEPDIVVPTRVISSKTSSGRLPVVVYLRDRLGERDDPSILETLARRGRLVAVADVRGFGETWSPGTVREVGASYYDPRDGTDADFTYASFFLGRPLLGMRVWDALNVVECIRTRPDIDATRISIVGRGWAGVIAVFAAALDPLVAGVAAEDIPASYAEMALAHLYNQPASLLLPGVLRHFDLPDVLASIAPRPLLVLNPLNALGKRMDREKAQLALEEVRLKYQTAQAPQLFEVGVVPIESDMRAALVRWILDR